MQPPHPKVWNEHLASYVSYVTSSYKACTNFRVPTATYYIPMTWRPVQALIAGNSMVHHCTVSQVTLFQLAESRKITSIAKEQLQKAKEFKEIKRKEHVGQFYQKQREAKIIDELITKERQEIDEYIS